MTERRANPDEPGFGREEDMEAARRRDRPAGADMDADRQGAEREPTITVSPDPEGEER